MQGEHLELRVITFESAEPVLRLNPSAGPFTMLGHQFEIECSHGERRMKLFLIFDERLAQNSIAMSRMAVEQLRLTAYSVPMGRTGDAGGVAAMVTEKRIRFGPLIGILANPQWDKDRRTLHKSVQLEGLTRLVEVGREHGATCFLFSLTGVDIRQGMITGYVFREGKWLRRTLPMPDVIYDQLVSRKRERDTTVQDKRSALSRRYGNRFFNDGFFDKWQVFEWLKKDARVKSHVPETQRHTTLQSASSFLNRHIVTFLKPLHGSLGLGIARFVKSSDGSISYELKQKTSSITRGRATSAKEVLQSFRTRLKNRPYIWQEGLSLATYQNRPVDIRILMQRDHTGEWKRTKMFARVAKNGDFTSNLTAGGDAMLVDDALVQCIPKAEGRTRAKLQIRRLSQEIAEAMEAGSGRTFGELGIDLGLDTTGKVWVIEVNSKPRKAPTTEKGRQDLVDLSFERPIRYAIYLATEAAK